MLWPSNWTMPRVGCNSPVSIFTVVLLPEPFGPRHPNTCPGRNENDKSCTAGRDA